MNNNSAILLSVKFKMEYTRDILNTLLLYFNPTDRIVVQISKELDIYINKYNNIILNCSKHNITYII